MDIPLTRPPTFGNLSWQRVLHIAGDYLKYCESQPMTLFLQEDFLATLSTRDPEVVYGILALATLFFS